MPVPTHDEQAIFDAARQIKVPGARDAYLQRECAGDAALLTRIRALLDVLEAEPAFLESPALSLQSAIAPALRTGANIDRYRLVELIGEGGMGEVWKAEQIEPVKRLVALKLIKAGKDSRQVLARFEAERQALALMNHPNIAKILDAGVTVNSLPYFVMELVQGPSITRYCDEQRLSPRQRLELFMPVCHGIQHAHQKGIIHRDIKPSNVLIAQQDGQPVPKVIDFGVAKAIDVDMTIVSFQTQFGMVVGTPQYMSPEQADAANQDVDTRTDVYSLGVLLYELLTGSPPFNKQTLAEAGVLEMLRIIREVEPQTPSTKVSSADELPNIAANRNLEPKQLTSQLRRDLDWIVMRSIEKDRNRRYATANGLARDIERYLNDEPVEAGPPTVGYRFRKFLRRNRGPVIAATLLLLALVGGIVGTSVGLFHAEQQRKRAEDAVAAERQANESAQKRLAQIEMGVELFAGLVTGINPRNEELGGPTLYEQLRERAEKAADELKAESVGDPLAVARLQSVLGNTLRDLGNSAKAIEFLENARSVQEAKLGADHPDALTSRNYLAFAYQAAGRRDKALSLFESTLKASEAALGANHPDTLMSRNNLATAYQAAGRLDKALPLFEATLKAREATLGVEHAATLVSGNNLALAYQAAGHLDKALPLFEATLQAREATLGLDHPSTLTSRSNLALAYKAAGQLDKALPLYEATLRVREAKLGHDHPDTLTSRSNLARAYQDAGQLDKALPLFEATLKAREAKLGADHPATLTSRNNLASAYKAAGQLDRALPLYEATLRTREVKLGADHPDTLISRNNLAFAYKAAGQLNKALPLYEATLRDREVKLGADHPSTLASRNNLASTYQAAGQLNKALPLYEQAAKGMEKRKYQHEHAGLYVQNAISAYEEAKDFAMAESWWRKWVAHVKEKSGAESPAYAAELAGLGENLIQQNKHGEAEAVLRECLAVREIKKPDDWRTFNTQSLLGAALLGQEKYADAEPLLLSAQRNLAKEKPNDKSPGPTPDMLMKTVDRLVRLYEAWDKPAEAEKWRIIQSIHKQ